MFLDQSFETAKENMMYDLSLVDQLKQGELTHFFRLYRWKKCGLTYPDKRAMPDDLKGFDYSSRLTGGGVVFHSPGDLVFSQGALITDNRYPKSLKERCKWFSEELYSMLRDAGIPVEFSVKKKSDVQNINFCTAYHNPYELVIGNDKIVGIALRKTRDWIVFQGVIHFQPTITWFSSIHLHYNDYFTKGIQNFCDIDSRFVQQFCKERYKLDFNDDEFFFHLK